MQTTLAEHMQLPESLQTAIEKEISHKSLQSISEASSQLTQRYRSGSKEESYVKSEKDRLAYILSRMPATYAVIYKVFEELQNRIPAFLPTRFLDLGSGPGTGLWAAKEAFPSLQQMYAWEYDEGFIELAKRLATESDLQPVEWKKKNFKVDRDFPVVDLALISYAIGEIEESYWESFLHALWDAVKSTLVIIEPGTPAGYQRILKIRDILLRKGARIIAPCPHPAACPLQSPDWCHFYARIERSSLHRRIKQADLNYEDEKFSYLIFTKENAISLFGSRIIRHPKINKGHVNVTLCSKKEEIIQETITKKDKDKYKIIKKSDWGDTI